METANGNYWVGWLRHSRPEAGCITHACEDGKDRALCGAVPTDGGLRPLANTNSHVGCKRCASILTKRGVLPLPGKGLGDRTKATAQ